MLFFNCSASLSVWSVYKAKMYLSFPVSEVTPMLVLGENTATFFPLIVSVLKSGYDMIV